MTDVVGLRALAEKALDELDRFAHSHRVQSNPNGPGVQRPDHRESAERYESYADVVREVPALLDEITTLRAEVADRDADDQRRSEEGRTDWDYEQKIARAEAALADRDARIEALQKMHRPKQGESPRYAPGEGYPENEPTHFEPYTICDYDKTSWPCKTHQILEDAVPVPQDNPEPPTDDERVSQLMAYVTPLGYSAALSLVNAQTEMLKEQRRRPALHELRELGSALVSDEAQDNPEPTREALTRTIANARSDDDFDLGEFIGDRPLADAILAAFNVRAKRATRETNGGE